MTTEFQWFYTLSADFVKKYLAQLVIVNCFPDGRQYPPCSFYQRNHALKAITETESFQGYGKVRFWDLILKEKSGEFLKLKLFKFIYIVTVSNTRSAIITALLKDIS